MTSFIHTLQDTASTSTNNSNSNVYIYVRVCEYSYDAYLNTSSVISYLT